MNVLSSKSLRKTTSLDRVESDAVLDRGRSGIASLTISEEVKKGLDRDGDDLSEKRGAQRERDGRDMLREAGERERCLIRAKILKCLFSTAF